MPHTPEPEDLHPAQDASKPPSRREFLKVAAAGAAAFGLNPSPVHASVKHSRSAASTQANSRIGIGMVGVGGRGTALFFDLLSRSRSVKDVEIVAVCDVWDRRTQDRVRDTGGRARGTRDYRELLHMPGVDAVVIATPDHWHSRITIDAMRAGKDVYCEKPLTLYWQQARDVARVSADTKRVLQCGAGSGSDGNWWTAGDIVKQGGIGPVIWAQGGAFRNDPGGDWNWPIQPCKPGKDLDWDMWLGWKFGLAPKRPYDPERYSRFRKFWDYSGGLATDLLYHVYAHLAIALNHELPYRVTASGGQPIHNLKNDHREVPTLFTMLADYPSQSTLFMVGTQECDDAIPDTIRGQKAVLTPGGPGLIVRPQNAFRNDMLELAHTLECYRGAELVTHKNGDTTVLDEIRVPPRYTYDHMGNWLECIRTRNEPTLNAERAYRVMIPIALSVMAFRTGKDIYFDPAKQEVVSKNPLPVSG
ncbi:MAG: Gfo/Idh/MocA family protein [Chthonomonadales bacterium]